MSDPSISERHPSPSPEATEPPSLAFGAGDFVSALGDRLERSLESSADEGAVEALVVGIYGAWGSGKTTVLRALQERFAPSDDANPDAPLTLPILFNAWRYEKEEHLIVPLLKTAEAVVRQWGEKQPSDSKWDWVKDRARLVGHAALALACGLKGKFTLPFAEVTFDTDNVVAEARRIAEAEEEKQATGTVLQQLSSLYYDFHGTMRRLTGRSAPDAPDLNLLFLIDDLDRCLPEKAVEMLEAIKLFLEVEGCAFVVAVDDEVVARGIAHRYRDYNVGTHQPYDSVAYSLKPERFEAFEEKRGPLPQQPITGTEYLEKIIHLPFRLPAPTEPSAREFLIGQYPELFDAEAVSRPPGAEKGKPAQGTGRRSRVAADVEPEHPEPAREDDREMQEARRREELLALFLHCVPRVPRKLIRAAELFALLRDVAHARGWSRVDELTLARLVFLQLFAPALYRFGRNQPTYLATLEKWSKSPYWMTRGYLEEQIKGKAAAIKAEIEQADAPGNQTDRSGELYDLQQRERPLLILVNEATRNRSGFDPRTLVSGRSSAKSLIDYYHLLDSKTESAVFALARETEAATSPPRGAPGDPEAFLAQLSSGDPLAWRNALEQEADRLRDRVLDGATFSLLLDRIRNRPKVVTVPWLETLEPHLDARQLAEIYRVSDLLPRLAREIAGGSHE